MTLRVAINGFGRIGRLILRLMKRAPNLEIVAINDLVPPDNLAYLLKFDTVHGRFQGSVTAKEHEIVVNGEPIAVFSEKNPEQLPWKKLGIDYVVESTGLFTSYDEAKRHLQAGAKRVVISAPAKGDVPTFVMGVNDAHYNPKTDFIVSNASCTTNCLAPIAKVLLDQFGIEEGLMTTVHSVTASQPTVDGPSKKDWRGGRAAGQNIIPASTGAAKAVGLCLPQLQGKLTGMALRVPTIDVSAVDLTVRLREATTYEDLCVCMQQAAQGSMKGFLEYCDEQVVSSDFIGSTASAIFDSKAGIALNNRFFKLIAWYDNEMGYSARVVDLLAEMARKES